jgi:hypothetical protein
VARLVRARRAGEPTGPAWAWTLGGAVAAALVFLAIALPWPAYVYLRVPLALEIWRAESVDRSTGEYGHQESVFFYLVRLPVLLAPWTVFLVGGIVMAIRRARRDATSRPWWLFVGAWGAGTLVAFSAAAGKQDHYILPLIPAIAVFAALAMRRWLAPGRPPRAAGPPAAEWTGRCVLVAHGIASILLGLIGVVAYGLWRAGPATLTHLRLPQALMTSAVMSPAAILGGTAIVGGAVVCLLAVRRRLTAGLAVLVATFAVAFLWAWPTLMGPLDRATTALEFARQVRRQVPADMPLFSFAGANNMLVYQIQRPLVVLASPGTVQDQVGRGRPFYLICEERHLEALAPVAGLERVIHVPAPYQPREGYWLFRNASVTGG